MENGGYWANVSLYVLTNPIDILGISNREFEVALPILMPVNRCS